MENLGTMRFVCCVRNLVWEFLPTIQISAERRAPGLENFVPAVAYHFCLAFPAVFTQPGARLLAEPCRYIQGSREECLIWMSSLFLKRPGPPSVDVWGCRTFRCNVFTPCRRLDEQRRSENRWDMYKFEGRIGFDWLENWSSNAAGSPSWTTAKIQYMQASRLKS